MRGPATRGVSREKTQADCAYYTPMLSDPFRGLVQFRKLVDLGTMASVVNGFSGERIPDFFIDNAAHGFERFDPRRVRRRKKFTYKLRKALGLLPKESAAPKRM